MPMSISACIMPALSCSLGLRCYKLSELLLQDVQQVKRHTPEGGCQLPANHQLHTGLVTMGLCRM